MQAVMRKREGIERRQITPARGTGNGVNWQRMATSNGQRVTAATGSNGGNGPTALRPYGNGVRHTFMCAKKRDGASDR